MTKPRANFSIVMNTPEWILIRDNCDETITMSVTNDAENVVKFLKENAFLFKETKLYSICTDGPIDLLKHDGNGKFLGFEPTIFKNEEEFFNSNNKY